MVQVKNLGISSLKNQGKTKHLALSVHLDFLLQIQIIPLKKQTLG